MSLAEATILPVEGRERVMGADDLIVSKTNLKGHITYANDVFLKIADLTLAETIGKPHSLIRSRAMPRSVFQLLWENIQAGTEVFAYIVNKSKFGDHYWVFAHVTPSFDAKGDIVGYHSNRRKPRPEAIEEISHLYRRLLAAEASVKNAKQGMQAGYTELQHTLQTLGMDYDRYVLSL